MSFTNFLENSVLDYLYGKTTYTPSGTIYLAFSTTQPAEDGSSFTEPASASGYARFPMVNNKNVWSTSVQVSTSGEVHNLSGITFGTASGNWGTIAYFGIYDASGGGNLLNQGPLSASKSPTSGDVISLASGAISIKLD